MCKSCDKTCPICEEQTWETHTDLCRSCYLATERIIKLLEHMPRTDNDRTVDAPTLIALINGEQK